MPAGSLGLAIFLFAVAALGGVCVAFVRFLINERKRAEARRDSLREGLARRGFVGGNGAAAPGDLPDWEVTAGRRRAKVALAAERAGVTLVVSYRETSERLSSGHNIEFTGTDPVSTSCRHTIVCLSAPGMDLPRFEILPDVGHLVESAVPGSSAEIDQTPGALRGPQDEGFGTGLLAHLVGWTLSRMERPGALSIAGLESLRGRFKIYGEDPVAIGQSVNDAACARLLADPGLILAGDGPWLLCTRNVRLAGFDPDKNLPLGLLSPEQTDDLVELALSLYEELRT